MNIDLLSADYDIGYLFAPTPGQTVGSCYTLGADDAKADSEKTGGFTKLTNALDSLINIGGKAAQIYKDVKGTQEFKNLTPEEQKDIKLTIENKTGEKIPSNTLYVVGGSVVTAALIIAIASKKRRRR